MCRLRFSIASLLGLVVCVAVGFAALRAATDLWDSAVFSAALGLLLVSVLMAVHRTERRKAFWVGFAVFGWTGLLASLVPPIEARLSTTKLLAYLDSSALGRGNVETLSIAIDTSTSSASQSDLLVAISPSATAANTGRPLSVKLWDVATGKRVSANSGTTENFLRIGHSLIALLLGWLGGQVSKFLHARAHPES
jgi:hypothetical protein